MPEVNKDLDRNQRRVLAGLAEDRVAQLYSLFRQGDLSDGMANSINDDIDELRKAIKILLEDDDEA